MPIGGRSPSLCLERGKGKQIQVEVNQSNFGWKAMGTEFSSRPRMRNTTRTVNVDRCGTVSALQTKVGYSEVDADGAVDHPGWWYRYKKKNDWLPWGSSYSAVTGLFVAIAG